MACDRCIGAMRDSMVIGPPVECQCDYCGQRFTVGGMRSPCLDCDEYWSEKTDDGIRYRCHAEECDKAGVL